MEYIDKNKNLEEGNSYSSDYLYDSFNEEGQCFFPAVNTEQAYKDFSRKKYRYGEGLDDGRKGLEPLLIKEQNDRCCYCMGRIMSGDVALEHIVPRSFDKLNAQDEFRFYAECTSIIAENVELADTFAQRNLTSKAEIRQLTKYPHLVSYVNLAASCHGLIKKNGAYCFCNHPRGNKRIIPLMLMTDASTSVRYDKFGSIITYGHDDIFRNTVDILNLNHETLQEIRLLWYKISRKYETIEDVLAKIERKESISLLKTLFGKDDFTELDERWQKYASTSFDAYWELFIKYDWFYDYYDTNYPIP